MTKAKQINDFDRLMGRLTHVEQAIVAQFGKDKYEQGKKNALPINTRIAYIEIGRKHERIATLEEASILSDAKILEAKRELLHKIRIEYGKMGGGYVFDDDFDDYLEDLDRIFELKQIKKKELEQHLKEAKGDD